MASRRWPACGGGAGDGLALVPGRGAAVREDRARVAREAWDARDEFVRRSERAQTLTGRLRVFVGCPTTCWL